MDRGLEMWGAGADVGSLRNRTLWGLRGCSADAREGQLVHVILQRIVVAGQQPPLAGNPERPRYAGPSGLPFSFWVTQDVPKKLWNRVARRFEVSGGTIPSGIRSQFGRARHGWLLSRQSRLSRLVTCAFPVEYAGTCTKSRFSDRNARPGNPYVRGRRLLPSLLCGVRYNPRAWLQTRSTPLCLGGQPSCSPHWPSLHNPRSLVLRLRLGACLSTVRKHCDPLVT